MCNFCVTGKHDLCREKSCFCPHRVAILDFVKLNRERRQDKYQRHKADILKRRQQMMRANVAS